jgi:GDPmannose 4,6-dehydratase
MKKALIFGVTGQDGSHLADLLLKKGYKVIGLARRTSTSNRERVNHLLKGINFTIEECDITDAHSVYWTLDKHTDADEVYNLAAQSFVGISFRQPGLTWDATGKGCLNILQSMVDLKMTDCKFYQASSSEMFGSAFTHVHQDIRCDYDLTTQLGKDILSNAPGDKFQDENTKFLPQSPYAIAKCAAHYMTRLYREAYGLHASAGILFNHEGPRRGDQFVTRKITKWIGDYIKWCETHGIKPNDVSDCNKTDTLFINFNYKNNPAYSFPKLKLGNIYASRDWGYAGDFVEAMWLMLQVPEPGDYVICTEETHTVEDFLRIAFNYVGLDWTKFVTIDQELFRPAEVDYLCGNASKAKTLLNWTPRHSFSDLVKMMVDGDLYE